MPIAKTIPEGTRLLFHVDNHGCERVQPDRGERPLTRWYRSGTFGVAPPRGHVCGSLVCELRSIRIAPFNTIDDSDARALMRLRRQQLFGNGTRHWRRRPRRARRFGAPGSRRRWRQRLQVVTLEAHRFDPQLIDVAEEDLGRLSELGPRQRRAALRSSRFVRPTTAAGTTRTGSSFPRTRVPSQLGRRRGVPNATLEGTWDCDARGYSRVRRGGVGRSVLLRSRRRTLG